MTTNANRGEAPARNADSGPCNTLCAINTKRTPLFRSRRRQDRRNSPRPYRGTPCTRSLQVTFYAGGASPLEGVPPSPYGSTGVTLLRYSPGHRAPGVPQDELEGSRSLQPIIIARCWGIGPAPRVYSIPIQFFGGDSMRAKKARALRKAVMAGEYDHLATPVPPRKKGWTMFNRSRRMRPYRVAKRMTSRGQL